MLLKILCAIMKGTEIQDMTQKYGMIEINKL